ncbi:beta-L-arabinofuranosidase domain-containing protein [Actinoallomurus sp. NPDC052274]|uniref:glycoside hydrolase family 127 protein n=1 Tax=Actinoallomurus sp. NPDC052274 TaxID=3155420 RepID=UPI00342FD10B
MPERTGASAPKGMRAPFSRRGFLGVAGGAVAAVGLAAPARTASAAAVASAAPAVAPFPLSGVALLASRFHDNMDRTCAYLKFVDTDRLLHMFRVNVGLPSTAEPCGGWEAPDVQLRGHSTGHLLSALAQAHANTGDDAYAAKGRHLVGELAKCQAAAPGAGYTTGYLSAFEEKVFDQLEAGGKPWAPYYTLHKIMAGLLDQYRLSGNAQALDVLKAMAAWADARTSKLTHDQMQTVLSVEFGGMNDVLAELYLLTRDPAHLRTAQRFDHDAVFGPLAAGQDQLAGLHANTQIPKIVGAVREYEATGDTRYLDIATFFWRTVVRHHSYAIGGNSNAELFCPPDQIVSQLGENTCENCNSYNMLKLTRLLFFHDPRPEYMDYYEWTLYNQMLGEQDPDSAHGFCTYYTGLWPGTQRQVKGGLGADPGSYSSDYTNFSCDHGTGMETHTKFADSIYFRTGRTLYVNLFIPSELSWAERGVRIRQETRFPDEDTIRLTVSGEGRFTMKIRIPGWTRHARVRINRRDAGAARAGTYLTIERRWRDGDTVEVTLPMGLDWRKAPDNPQVQALSYGPVVLAGGPGGTQPATIPVIDPKSVRAGGDDLTFTAKAGGSDVTLIPFSEIQHQRYTVYWAVPPGPAKPRLTARYPFGEGSGTTSKDATKTWPDATLVGGATWTGDGAVALDGKGGHVVLPPGLISGLEALTITAWVNPEELANSARVFDLGFHKNTYLFLTVRTGLGKARFAMKIAGMSAEDYVDAAGPIPAGTWTHVAVTIADGSAVLYFDGAETGRNDGLVMSPLLLGATQLNYLGRSQNSSHPYLHGQVDDFRVYNHALSAADVAALHAQGRTS